ncbi:MAG: hypothetical protein IK066_02935 [Kiritimatiellae bacterium]|nr:hypothetical protein [Kiritimatiellia bacterium]
MTLGINDIRNFSAGDRLVFDTRDGTLKAAGKWQNFKSIVGIGDARAQNALTLAAIHHAIAAEPRFFSQTIQDEAYRLLSEVRTDRAIDAAQIKGIVEHLEALSTHDTRREAAEDRVGAHIAARGLPIAVPPAAGPAYMALAKMEIVPRKEPEGGYGRIAFASGLDAFDARIGHFFAHLGNGAGDAASVAKFLPEAGCGKNMAELAALGDALRANYGETRALGAQYGDQARLDAVAALEDLKKPLAPTAAAPAPLRALVEAGRAARAPLLARLDGQSTSFDIHRALEEFAAALSRLPAVASFAPGNDRAAALALAAKSALNMIPAAAKRNLLAALESDAGKQVAAFCREESANPDAKALFDVARTAGLHLRAVLGGPRQEIPLPEHPDPARLSPAILNRYSFSADRFLSGSATAYFKPYVDAFARDNAADPLAAFRRQVSERAVAKTILTIAEQLEESLEIVKDGHGKRQSAIQHTDWCIQYAKDQNRSFTVRFPDGSSIVSSMSLADARTKLLRFVTGDDSAVWAPEVPGREEDPGVVRNKVKVLVVMALMNQATYGVASSAVAEVFGEDKARWEAPVAMLPDSSGLTQGATLSKDANGDITVHYQSSCPMAYLTDYRQTQMISLAPGSHAIYDMEVRLPAANLDALSRADWTQLDTAEAKKVERGQSQENSIGAVGKIPEEFRFAGTAAVSAHYHLVKA